MKRRQYYSVRTGKHPTGLRYDMDTLRRLFVTSYSAFDSQGYFQEAFGYDCVDAGHVPGTIGSDIAAAIYLALRKDNLWPIEVFVKDYSEDDLFDVIEYLHDHISKPIEGYHHSYGNCGMHFSSFDHETGQHEYREKLNHILEGYQGGFQLSDQGELLQAADKGLANLLEASLPVLDPSNIEARVDAAILKFRRYRASLDDRRDAIRDLVDVLEFLRPQVQQVLTKKDENDLFAIANNFGIRHHNDKQKTDFDRSVWYSWLFYYYLVPIPERGFSRKAVPGTDGGRG